MASIAGKTTPSPRPSIILTAYSKYTFWFDATGVRRVNIDVIRIPGNVKKKLLKYYY